MNPGVKAVHSRDTENIWTKSLLEWYREVKRDLPWRKTNDPYFIWLSEVMLQQTQVKTVIPYYTNFLRRFPDLRTLAQASLEEVLELWRGLGYYSRARHLWEGARYLVEHGEEKLPGDYQSLLKIPGVGEYTAGAIASIAFGECVPVLDGNVKRVVARFLAWEEAVESAKTRRVFMTHLKTWQPLEQAGDFNQAMMELGATICIPKSPKCLDCPLHEGCQGYRTGTPQVYPVKRNKEKITEAIRPTLIIRREGKVLLKRRPAEGLLANLWEFPGEEILLEGADPIDSSIRVAEKQSLYELSEKTKTKFPWSALYQNQVTDRSHDVLVKELLQKELNIHGPLMHTFSHRRWTIFWIVLDLNDGEDLKEADHLGALRWFDEKEMAKIALPVAFQKVWASIT
jgi:A/G-specific adenine glycosylase